MSRKDYVKFATMVANLSDREVAREVALELCAILRADNDRFDKGRFLTACGVAL